MANIMHMKLSTRLVLSSLLLSIVPIVIISIYTLQISRIELEKDVYQMLNLALDARRDGLIGYLDLTRKQLTTMAADQTIISAIKDLSTAVSGLESDLGKRYDAEALAHEGLLKARYAYQESNTPDAPKDAMARWWPRDRITRMLQHYYISANPYPVEEKLKFDFSADGSRYSQVHHQIQPILRDFTAQYKYHNVFLIDATTGRIVHDVKKGVDFATSLTTGPYSDTSLAKIFKAAMQSDTVGSIHFVDIAPYAPDFNRHSSFIATPIFDGDTKIGVLAFQLGTHRLADVITDHREGMGTTGETILVGSDHLLRTEALHLIEEPTKFIELLKKAGIAEDTTKNVEEHRTAINYIEYQSPAVDAALSGKSGALRTTSYLGESVVAVYAPVAFEGVNWALAVTMDEDEAFATLDQLSITILWVAALLAGLAAIIGWLVARAISNPIAETVNILSSSSNEMAATTNQQERIANQQASSVNETNTTMEELSISSKQSAQQAQIASDSTQSVLTLAEEGGHQVQEMLHGMETLRDKVAAIAQQILKLSEQTSQIGTITGVMTDFANETKMLAMNAAVEAVRAGEHGKGFSVLSVEIRKLAEESKRSAERINALVADVQKATNATVMATEEGTKTVEKTIDLAHTTAASFNSVSESMHTVSTSAQQISLNIKQQAEAVRQVVVAMNELRTGAREGAAGISQTKEGIKLLNEAAQKLKAMV